MITIAEIARRKKISKTMKLLRHTTLPPWNKGKKCPQISKAQKGRTPWNKGTRGAMGIRETHPNWKGGKSIMLGYVRIYKPNHPNADSAGQIREHRFVMAEFLGRPLKPNEHIHHIDGNKLNNKLNNLLLITNSKHNKLHFPHGWNPDRKIK